MKTSRKIIKSRKQFKKLLILTGIYAIFAAIISFSVIFLINNSIVTHTDDVSNIKSVSESSNVTESNNICFVHIHISSKSGKLLTLK